LTFAPDRINGGLAPVGDSRDCWMSSEMIEAISTPWVAQHEHLVDAIVHALHGGAQSSTFSVAI